MSAFIKNIFHASLLAMVFSGSASGDEIKPEEAIKYRQSIMSVMRWQLLSIGAMEKGERPMDKDLLLKNATYLEMLSKLSPESFVPGTDKGETKARPEVWSQMDKFRGAMDKLQNDTANLVQVAKTGDKDQIKAQFGQIQKTCKACHQDFRKK